MFQKSKAVGFRSVVSSWLGPLGECCEAWLVHSHCEEGWNGPRKGEGTRRGRSLGLSLASADDQFLALIKSL